MLRDYQQGIIAAIKAEWASDHKNVMAVMPTGAGKTVTMAALDAEQDCPSVAIAHRQELVMQISVAFARDGIKHRIIAPNAVQKAIIDQHILETGKSWVNPAAKTAVAGIDSLINRTDEYLEKVEFWQTDEAHHVLETNKWGGGIGMLPAAKKGVGWTATPCRTDKKALRRGAGGVFESLVVGPTMRELIDRQYLAEYRIYSLPVSVHVENVTIGGNGEFNGKKLAEETKKSGITGDIVKHYQKLAPGKSGVTFAVDVELATEHAQAFRDAGVSAAVLSAKTPNAERLRIIRGFRNRELMQIVNVDVLGEGFDCPGIEVCSFARPTMSFGLYVQQFGRALRPKEGKEFGLILDHVGNVKRHRGAPDGPRDWTLDSTKKPKGELEIPIRVCGNEECMQVFEAFSRQCPYCGWEATLGEREKRERPEIMEGDLTLYTPQMLAELRAEIARVQGDAEIPHGLSDIAREGVIKTWDRRANQSITLEKTLDKWAGHWHHAKGEPVPAIYSRFWHIFGMTTAEALAQSVSKQKQIMEKLPW